MTAPKRHQPKVVRNFARNPRRIARDQADLTEKQSVETDTLVEERPAAAHRSRNRRPTSITRQSLIDAGLLKPGKVNPI